MMVSPTPGSIRVSSETDIILQFPEDGDIDVSVNGESAIYGGKIVSGWRTTQKKTHGDYLRWGIRPKGGFDQRDVFVQAWIDDRPVTKNARFYVRGASTPAPSPDAATIDSVRRPDGLISVKEGKVSSPWGHIDIPPDWTDPEIFESGSIVFRGAGVWGRFSEGSWSAYSLPDELVGGEILATEEKMFSNQKGEILEVEWGQKKAHVWEIFAHRMHLSENYIHLDVGRRSAHLPLEFEPMFHERTLEDWHVFGHEFMGEGKFFDRYGVWHNEEQLEAHHHFNPLIADSQGMLWESADLGEPIEDVELIEQDRVLVNDKFYLNTRHPEITRV